MKRLAVVSIFIAVCFFGDILSCPAQQYSIPPELFGGFVPTELSNLLNPSASMQTNTLCTLLPSLCSSSTTTASITEPKLILPLDIPDGTSGSFVSKEISITEVGNRTSVAVEPILTFYSLPSGTYDLYAAIMNSDGSLYLATKDITSQIVFIKWLGEEVRSYETQNFTEARQDQVIAFTAFEKLILSEPLLLLCQLTLKLLNCT